MNIEPETYEELIRMKRCIELTKYYELSDQELEKIYVFLSENKDGQIKGGTVNISLMIENQAPSAVIPVKRLTLSIDGVLLTNKVLIVYPHHNPSSGGGSGSGGSSSNNNNNNNNNNG